MLILYDLMLVSMTGRADRHFKVNKWFHLEVEGLRLILEEVKAELVGQQHIVLHGPHCQNIYGVSQAQTWNCLQHLCQSYKEGAGMGAHLGTLQEALEDFGHFWSVVQEQETLADAHPVRFLNALI